MYSADEILKISESFPEKLFPNNESEAAKIYHSLMSFWHPDKNSDKNANKVSSHISRLYKLVIEKIKNNNWTEPNTIVFKCKDKKERSLRYKKIRDFELGRMAYGEQNLCYIVNNKSKDLFKNGINMIKNLSYKDDKMKKEMEKYLPSIIDTFETDKDEHVVVLSKSSDSFLLQDIIDFYKGSLDPKHTAWILSSIYNISCYLKCFNICHNAISANNCFVSPKYHSVMLLGGWWYSCRKDDNIVALPKVSFKTCPPDILNTKIADHRLDLLLIRQLGIYCLGDDTGMDLLTRKDVPKPLTNFLRSSSSGDALRDYSYWQKEVLPNSFGKRRFVEMNVKSSDIFQEI